jgi:hypothetical protein
MTNNITYTPDAWVVVKIQQVGSEEILYKVFAQWYGGYTTGDSWKMNSGIVQASTDDNYYKFEGYSGSTYWCHKNSYRTTGYGNSVLNKIINDMKVHGYDVIILDDCNWAEFNYGV